jgi:hypothetical protein
MADVILTHEQVCALACRAAGAGSGAVMEEAPNVVMPTDKIIPAIRDIVSEVAGFDMADVPGYSGGLR